MKTQFKKKTYLCLHILDTMFLHNLCIMHNYYAWITWKKYFIYCYVKIKERNLFSVIINLFIMNTSFCNNVLKKPISPFIWLSFKWNYYWSSGRICFSFNFIYFWHFSWRTFSHSFKGKIVCYIKWNLVFRFSNNIISCVIQLLFWNLFYIMNIILIRT